MTANQSYLLLGEGDFTFSLDMCRYLASLSIDERKGEATATAAPTSISVTCTGVDTIEELRQKYKDIDFILRNIRGCCSRLENDNTNSRLLVNSTTLHGINAVQAECSGKDVSSQKDAMMCQSFDHVLFHHPHLGTENAQLHSRFLQHFFHAANKRWIKPKTGMLYLTLVDGQCSRWNCLEGAKNHGLILLRRKKFVSPPPPLAENGEKTYYSLRRHQTGKSFANRRRMQGESVQGVQNESETLVFGRACDYSTTFSEGDICSVGLFPWESASSCANAAGTLKDATPMEATKPTIPTSEMSSSNGNVDPYPCPHCPKSFQQHRSMKNHMICSHPDCEEVRIWKLEKKKKKIKKRKWRSDDENKFLDVGDDGNAGTRQSTNDVENSISTIAPCGNDYTGLQGPPWICIICASQHKAPQEQPARKFPHRQALLDHQRAKHYGAHSNIKPGWCKEVTNERSAKKEGNGDTEHHDNSPTEALMIGSCPICNLQYFSKLDELRHELEFVPSPSVVTNIISQTTTSTDASWLNNSQPTIFRCGHCSKTFRDLRAQLQHQNFCFPPNVLDSGNGT